MPDGRTPAQDPSRPPSGRLFTEFLTNALAPVHSSCPAGGNANSPLGGKGGWFRAWEVERQLQAQKEENRRLEQRNAGLEAEVRDLKSGYEAIEERARIELGLVRSDEIFVQLPDKQPR